MDIEQKYYVYGIYDEQNICRYIGKGKGNRVKMHFNNYSSNKLLQECLNKNYKMKIYVQNDDWNKFLCLNKYWNNC